MTVLVAADVKLLSANSFQSEAASLLNLCSQRRRRGWSDKADERHSLAGSVFTLTMY